MIRAPDRIALVVTGSVAAVKTVRLADALRARGCAVDFIITPAAWEFLAVGDTYGITAEKLAALKSAARGAEALAGADIILVAPASAGFISHISSGGGAMGAAVREAGKPVFIVPAMNVMMWAHPAVQANVRRAMALGMQFLGPDCGGMACGDQGYGRMPEPEDIANAVCGDAGVLTRMAAAALINNPLLPQTTRQPCKKILLVMQAACALDDVRQLTARHDVRCVASPEARADMDIAALESLTGHPVCSEHYQFYPASGMEHIWLAEQADALVIYPAVPQYMAEMARGGAESFIGCVYLATKRPVIVIPAPDCDAADVETVVSHGAIVTNRAGMENALAGLRDDAAGKSFLVLGGAPRETVDSFRFYINTARPENHGATVAESLRARGAAVDFLHVASVREALEMCKGFGRTYDAVLQLANVSQFTCPAPVAHKISKTGAERAQLFEVAGNVNFIAGLRDIFGTEKVAGYDNYQAWTGAPALYLLSALPVAEQMEKDGTESMTGNPRVLVTTGRTEEKITTDGVVITNGFTGRQGQEIARAFAARGAAVTLVSGPSPLPDIVHPLVRTEHVKTMKDMQAAVMRGLENADIYISAAAIADFSVAQPLDTRLNPGARLRLDMEENPSIVGAVARHNRRPRAVVSFAAQSPDTLLDYAVRKFGELGVDMTIANPIGSGAAITRDSTRNEVYFITRNGVEKMAEASKAEVAEEIVARVLGKSS